MQMTELSASDVLATALLTIYCSAQPFLKSQMTLIFRAEGWHRPIAKGDWADRIDEAIRDLDKWYSEGKLKNP